MFFIENFGYSKKKNQNIVIFKILLKCLKYYKDFFPTFNKFEERN